MTINNIELDKLIDYIRDKDQTCLTCDHFDRPTELCKTYKKRPPARIIAYGCPEWVKDEIPF